MNKVILFFLTFLLVISTFGNSYARSNDFYLYIGLKEGTEWKFFRSDIGSEGLCYKIIEKSQNSFMGTGQIAFCSRNNLEHYNPIEKKLKNCSEEELAEMIINGMSKEEALKKCSK